MSELPQIVFTFLLLSQITICFSKDDSLFQKTKKETFEEWKAWKLVDCLFILLLLVSGGFYK